jgi:predicted nucleic acid-binding protein
MASRRMVFSDTNKLFWLYRAITLGATLENSVLLQYCRAHHIDVILSDYVVSELERIAYRNFVERNDVYLQLFITTTWFLIHDTLPADPKYLTYVLDTWDAQIVQDAVESGAEYILTNNTKDFHIKKIYDTFQILVIDDLVQVE